MELVADRVLFAPQDAVWNALNDADVLRQAIPGCSELVKCSDREFIAKVMLKVGPVKASFSGRVVLDNVNAPFGYTLVGEGNGGIAGFAKGRADVALEPIGLDQTRLSYSVHAAVGGKLAQLGARLIDSTARKLADEFFKRFDQRVSGERPATEPQPA